MDRPDTSQTTVRDPLADAALLKTSRNMTISERLESALNLNKFASELRESVDRAKSDKQTGH